MACPFCKVIAEQPERLVYQDDRVVAFPDIRPKAPVHLLIVPRQHMPTLADVGEEDLPLVAHLLWVANLLARREGIAQRGYRLLVNVGEGGGQTVFHLHLHLLGGRRLYE